MEYYFSQSFNSQLLYTSIFVFILIKLIYIFYYKEDTKFYWLLKGLIFVSIFLMFIRKESIEGFFSNVEEVSQLSILFVVLLNFPSYLSKYLAKKQINKEGSSKIDNTEDNITNNVNIADKTTDNNSSTDFYLALGMIFVLIFLCIIVCLQ